MDKTRFIIVGSGWRSLYYVRIAKALPDRFELCAMLCRTEERHRGWPVKTTSIQPHRNLNVRL
ncbi:MAG: hypothetical protein J6W39_00540 [Spirochaetales bacterium]|nr:hypothetical protein [Spirochaetales bacterium]